MGMKMSPSLCEKQYKKIIDKAKLYGNFVRIDMEDSSVTDQTLKLYDAMRKYYEKVGVVIQSYLFRSSDDIRALKGSGVNLRLCKGAYIEPGDLAYKSKDRGNSLNFLKLAEQILDAGHYVGFATHDRLLISDLIKIIDRKKIPQNKYEFQMLHGVPMGNIMNELKKRNDRVRIYVPFGKQWHPYLLRRIRENPNMISYVILNLFKR
jgi:proline dehydrogenase